MADLYPLAIYGANAGDHAVGTLAKEAGVACSAGTITFTVGSAHTLQPLTTSGITSPGFNDAYMMLQCTLGKDSATPGADHTAFTKQGTVAKIVHTTAGTWQFYVGGVLMYTHTPSGTHHVYFIFGKDGGWDATVARSWIVGDTVRCVVLIDKVQKFNGTATATEAATNLHNGAPSFGQSTTVSGGGTFTVSGIVYGQTTITAPVGKLTVAEWAMVANSGSGGDSGGVPYTGYDSGQKSSGTDAKALVDERPPNGSGTTDSDYVNLINNGTNLKQLVALTDTLLSAGDVLWAYHLYIWDRASGAAKTNSTYALHHDGTNVIQDALAILSSPTSYDYHGPGGSQPNIRINAPDSNPLTGKANAYLDGIQVGMEMNTGSTANAVLVFDMCLVEIAKVASGDGVTITSVLGRSQAWMM